jgi:hypothetical protein
MGMRALGVAGLLATSSAGCLREASTDRPSPDASTTPSLAAPRSLPAVTFTSRADGAFERTHAGAGLTAVVHARGARLWALAGTWSFELGVRALGRAGAMQSDAPSAPIRGLGGRIERAVSAGAREWWSIGPRAFEHGIDLERSPAGAGPLIIEIASDGLDPARAADGAIALALPSGAVVARYASLSVRAADDVEVPARLEIAGGRIRIVVDDAGARYPLRIDPSVFAIQQKITATAPVAKDSFASGVAVSGSVVVVGAQGRSGGAGAAYVFEPDATTGVWSQTADLTPKTLGSADQYGSSVAISGALAVVGAQGTSSFKGAGYIYSRGTSGAWTLESTVSPVDIGEMGYSAATDGTTVVFGAVGDVTNVGAAYVFTKSGTAWTLAQKLTPSDGAAGDYFGGSVAVSGSIIVVGATHHAGNLGQAYVFSRSGTTWSEQAKVVATDGVAGDYFGGSVSLGGSASAPLLGVGARGKNSSAGAAYVFAPSGTRWVQQAELKASDGAANDGFGAHLRLSGTRALVTSYARASGLGGAYVFSSSGTTWSEDAILAASGAVAGDQFGGSVGLDGATAVVGSILANGGAGAAYVFLDLQPNGTACTTGGGFCVSGLCTNGVCCSSGSCGSCGTCAGATPGSCAPLGAGSPGAGCAPYVCDGSATACPTTCTSSAGCAAGMVCDPSAHHCVAPTASDAGSEGGPVASDAASDGTTTTPSVPDAGNVAPSPSAIDGCKSDGDCHYPSRTHCVHGVCCDTACTGKCMSCTLSSSPGVCSPVPAGTDPAFDCGASGSCLGTCDGRGACTSVFAGAQCEPARCVTTSTGLGPAACSADLRSCETTAQAAFDCSPYACSVPFAACLQSCATTADCAEGFSCDTSTTPGKCTQAAAGESGGCSMTSRAVDVDARGWLALTGALGLAWARARRRARRSSSRG